MDLGLVGKRAWVVGGSAGIGKAAAVSLAREGASVAISSRHASRLDEAAAELRAVASGPIVTRQLDVMDARAIYRVCDDVVRELGGLDILISNSGGPPSGSFDDTEETAFVAAFDLLLGSAFRLTKAALPNLRQNGGVIVYITSSSTKEVLPNLLLSNTMRLGVLGMAKTLSKELARDGIRVLCVAPGRIATERVAALDAAAAERRGVDVEQVRRASMAEIPLGRYGEAREMGDAIAFLVSDRASYITGTTALIDGGRLSTVVS